MTSHGPWQRHARQWARIGPPLRPSEEDVAIVGAAIDGWTRATGRTDPALLLLGVTPELWSMDAIGTPRIAVDRSTAMIRGIWPGPLRPHDAALVGDWRRLPLRVASIDVALADGCLTNLAFPMGYAELCAELRRALASGGRWIARCFVRPARPEPLDRVLAALEEGDAGGFHALKWRLAMALQPDATVGVVLADVHDALAAAAPDLDALAARCGWSPEAVRTIEAYRGLDVRYTFPSLAELRGVVEGAGFEVLDVAVPRYELGSRCPTLVLA